MKHFDIVFWTLITLLADKGMTHLTTWVVSGNEKQKRMAEFFGFESTEYLKVLELEDGDHKVMEEMVLIFPTEETSE